MPYVSRECEVCSNTFRPRSGNNVSDGAKTRCVQCRQLGDMARMHDEDTRASLAEGIQPSIATVRAADWHKLAAPMTQVVFDLETWGLDRGWGVLLVGSAMIWKGGEPERVTLRHRDSGAWQKGIRSDDSEITRWILDVLSEAHIVYAHNGRDFDMKWLWTLALKHNLQPPRIKLVDPVQIARRRYRIGSNSLESIADFLKLPYSKMHIPPDVWRHALMDDDEAAWNMLSERCESDVELLALVAGHVTRDAGLIDYEGSGWK